jgi:hypothetical protein
VNILDENIALDEFEKLRKWRIPVRQIGYDIGHKGLQDPEIIPFLHRLRQPTLFTRDLDFYRRRLCHAQYCLVYLYVRPFEAAEYVRRVLRHPLVQHRRETDGHGDARRAGGIDGLAAAQRAGERRGLGRVVAVSNSFPTPFRFLPDAHR